MLHRCLARVVAGLLCAVPVLAQALAVVSTSPARNALNQSRSPAIVIQFDRPVQVASITAASFRVFGRSGGPLPGDIAYSNGNQTLTFTPTRRLFPGEQVTVNLANTVTAADATTLRQGGYAFQFLTVAGPAAMTMTTIDTVSVRTTAATTRLYGGNFVDFNRDGWIDYIAVNEVSADLRVLLNRADGSGRLGPVLLPPRQIGVEASPNESADFDNDGLMDFATGNGTSSSVSVVLGNGDGTFDPQQEIAVGTRPHGVAVLDADGDGDLDLVAASQLGTHPNGNTLNILRNNGSGVFTNITRIDSGGNGEYPLVSGDMDNDGILDLVVGTADDGQVHVMRGNGDGTFTRVHNRAAGGYTWMFALGDVDNDGNLDLASVNGFTNNGAIMLGNGDGTLDAPVIHNFGGGMVATDLGDLDGDGDLDWVASSFGAGLWYILRNDSGTFTQVDTVDAPNNASCASLYDFDNDDDLDLALADEIADVIVLVQNSGNIMFRDSFEGPP